LHGGDIRAGGELTDHRGRCSDSHGVGNPQWRNPGDGCPVPSQQVEHTALRLYSMAAQRAFHGGEVRRPVRRVQSGHIGLLSRM